MPLLDGVVAMLPGPEGPYGTGVIVCPGLVLTALHVARGARAIRSATAQETADVNLVWSDEQNDLALMRFTEGFAGPGVELGRICSDAPGLPVELLGYPRSQQVGNARDLEQATGFINPLSGPGSRFHITVQSGYWKADAEVSDAPWPGISGAPVFNNDLLVGIIKAGRAKAPHNRLEAVSVQALWESRSARKAMVLAAGGELPTFRGAEWGRLPRGLPRRRQHTDYWPAPSALLDPDRQVVLFGGRRATLGRLQSWAGAPGLQIGALTGPVGCGKTRISQAFVHDRLRAEWAVERILDGATRYLGEEQWTRLHRLNVPTLVVVDDAETRVMEIVELVRHLAYNQHVPVRILLCARTTGLWWEILGRRSAGFVSEEALTAFPIDEGDSPAANEVAELARAAERFHRALSKSRPEVGDFEPDVAAEDFKKTNVSSAAQSTVLDLHLVALGWALDVHAHPEADQVLDHLVRFEVHRLAKFVETLTRRPISPRTAQELLAALALFGIQSGARAQNIRAAMNAHGRDLPSEAIDAIREMYPGQHHDQISPVPIRFVAGRLIARTIAAAPEELIYLFPSVSERERTQALATLFGLAEEVPGLGHTLADYLRIDNDIPFETAATIGAMTAAPTALHAVLSAAYAHRPDDIAQFVSAATHPATVGPDITDRLWSGYIHAFPIPDLPIQQQAGAAEQHALAVQQHAEERENFLQAIAHVSILLGEFDAKKSAFSGQVQQLGGKLAYVGSEATAIGQALFFAAEELHHIPAESLRQIGRQLGHLSERLAAAAGALRSSEEEVMNLQQTVGPFRDLVKIAENVRRAIRKPDDGPEE